MEIHQMYGLELHSKDTTGLAKTKIELEAEALFEWFQSPPGTATTVYVKVLCVHLEKPSPLHGVRRSFTNPLPQDITDHAIWRSEVYRNLTDNPGGGAAGLPDEPYRFILQSPLDDDPFFSLAMSRHGILVKGIYFYDDDGVFSPFRLSGGAGSLSAWRSSGLQIVSLPQMLLETHSVLLSRRLATVVDRVTDVESALIGGGSAPLKFNALGQMLHKCNTALIDLERRSRFEQNIVEAIETVVAASRHGKIPWPALAPQRTALTSRSFDFVSLPRRIENAKSTISNLIQQRNEQLNIELAKSSSQIAEATLSDSKSMKSIAILTMIFLPGTATASFFSMALFNWNADDGSQLASKWLWIYFVITIPLTAAVIGIWWVWGRRRGTIPPWRDPGSEESADAAFRDEEAGPVGGADTESIEMQVSDAKLGTNP